MKIGIFGDSFAGPGSTVWWNFLKSNYGHDVECFGEPGSSLVFSARKILEKHHNYDLIIWCVTSSMRITVWHRSNYQEIPVHVTGRHHVINNDPEIQTKINATEQYLIHAWDAPDGEFVSTCVIKNVQNQVHNLLIIPCFPAPMNHIMDLSFNLFDLCQQETDHYFNGVPLGDVYDKYYDVREGHFTLSTHKKLAQLVAESLKPGIFTARYEDFPPPTESLDKVFRKIGS